MAIQPLVSVDRALAADLLRYYWFRLTDVALPLGVALEGAAWIVWAWHEAACDGPLRAGIGRGRGGVPPGRPRDELIVHPLPRSHGAIDSVAPLHAASEGF